MEKELLKKFLNNSTSEMSLDPSSGSGEISRICQGARISGDISSRTDMFIDGCIDGKIYSLGTVIVGPQAELKGALLCENVQMLGRMDGDIYVKGVLSIKNNAIVNGNIHVCKLEVEMGGQLNGSCKMISDQEFEKLRDEVITMEVPAHPSPRKNNTLKFVPSDSANEAPAAVSAVNVAGKKAGAVKRASDPKVEPLNLI